MKFPREVWPSANKQTNTFGTKRTLVHNKDEFNSWVKLHSGRMNCFTSVYDYKEYTHKQAVTSTVILDRVFLDFDAHHGEIDEVTGSQIINPEAIKKCLEDLNLVCQYLTIQDYKFDMSFSGRGFHVYVYGNTISSREIRRLTAFFNEVKKVTVNGTLDSSGIQERRLRRIRNTMNLKSSYGTGCYYCIPLELKHLFLDASDLLVLAMKPNNIPLTTYGKTLVNWPEVAPIEESEIEADVINVGNLPLPPCMHSAIMVENPTDDARMRVVSWYKELLLWTDLSIPFTNTDVVPDKETRNRIGNQIVAEIKNLHENHNVWLDFNEAITKQRMGSILEKNYSFPRCETLIGQGYCVGKCWRLQNAKNTV
tara:strand:+ start:73 stop:1173 length:1101 start_codon:yes stop_codon:yes gene_type:complete